MSARDQLAAYLRIYHPGVSVDDLELTETRGYWHIKGGCPGGNECRHAFRSALGPCSGGETLSLHISQHGRDSNGRYLRPYRLWEACKAEQQPSAEGDHDSA